MSLSRAMASQESASRALRTHVQRQCCAARKFPRRAHCFCMSAHENSRTHERHVKTRTRVSIQRQRKNSKKRYSPYVRCHLMSSALHPVKSDEDMEDRWDAPSRQCCTFICLHLSHRILHVHFVPDHNLHRVAHRRVHLHLTSPHALQALK